MKIETSKMWRLFTFGWESPTKASSSPAVISNLANEKPRVDQHGEWAAFFYWTGTCKTSFEHIFDFDANMKWRVL